MHNHHNHDHNNINHRNAQKTLIVIILTVITMVAEILYGFFSHSMALLADGWHMGTHALALTIAFCAYLYIEKFHNLSGAVDVSKRVSALAGYTSSMFLTLTAIWILYESITRLINPLQIAFNEAILVAFIGLGVNLLCVFIMEYKNSEAKNADYNYKAAYLHILTDAMTSIFAILALFSGKYFGWYFLDPIMGMVGGLLILKWGVGLIKDTSKILTNCDVLSK